MSASRAVGGVVLAEPGFAQRLAGLRQEEAQLDGVVALGLKIEDGTPTPAARHRLGKHAGDFTARGRDFRLRCLLPGQLAEPPAVEIDDQLHQPRRTRPRSEKHTSETQSINRILYTGFSIDKKT